MNLPQVLYEWRLLVTEQRRKQEQAARAAQVYRDQLLREGVTCILTYAAHMNDLTTSLTPHGQEQVGVSVRVVFEKFHLISDIKFDFMKCACDPQRSRHLQRVVKRCAMRWKQRALCKPGRKQEVKGQVPKKSVTFCLTTPGLKSVSPPDSAEQEAEEGVLSKL